MKTTAATSIASEKQVHGTSGQNIATCEAKRGRKWSSAEIEILREHYPLVGARGCSQYLPKRTLATIRVKAGQLDLKYDGYKPWSDAEIAIIGAHYPTGGARACTKRLPGRTVNAIRRYASHAGMTTRVDKRWSSAEIEVLRQHYPLLGAQGCVQYLPHRTCSAISVRAQKNNVKYSHHKAWTPEEISILKEKYPLGGAPECGKLLVRRTHKSISRVAQERIRCPPVCGEEFIAETGWIVQGKKGMRGDPMQGVRFRTDQPKKRSHETDCGDDPHAAVECLAEEKMETCDNCGINPVFWKISHDPESSYLSLWILNDMVFTNLTCHL